MERVFTDVDEIVLAEDADSESLDAIDELLEVFAAWREGVSVDVEVGLARPVERDDLEEMAPGSAEHLDATAAFVPIAVVSETSPSGVGAIELNDALGSGENGGRFGPVFCSVAEFPGGPE